MKHICIICHKKKRYYRRVGAQSGYAVSGMNGICFACYWRITSILRDLTARLPKERQQWKEWLEHVSVPFGGATLVEEARAAKPYIQKRMLRPEKRPEVKKETEA